MVDGHGQANIGLTKYCLMIVYVFFCVKVLELSPSAHTNIGYTMLAKFTIDRNNRS